VVSDDLTIACGDGALRLLKVQRAGGKAMAADELLKGFAVPKGTRFT
jgi:methionyl-tRNA formyltransferase